MFCILSEKGVILLLLDSIHTEGDERMIVFKEAKALKDYDSVSLAELIRSHFVESFPVSFVDKLSGAIQVASYLHRSDVRRGARGSSVTPPYIEHPLRVAIRLYKYFGVASADLIIAAILHDTVEDHAFEFSAFEGVPVVRDGDEVKARKLALEFISRHFGYAVAAIVEHVSNPVFVGERTKAEKIASYQAHVKAIVAVSDEALILKFSDFVDNAGSLHHHYAYNDRKVMYFVDRYSALIPIYREAFSSKAHSLFDADEALERLAKVEKQFDRFRAGE